MLTYINYTYKNKVCFEVEWLVAVSWQKLPLIANYFSVSAGKLLLLLLFLIYSSSFTPCCNANMPEADKEEKLLLNDSEGNVTQSVLALR